MSGPSSRAPVGKQFADRATRKMADTGELAVRYMPVFRVILANPQRFEVPETGALVGSVQLIECVSGDFG